MKQLRIILIVLACAQVGFSQLSGPLSGTLGPGTYHVIGTISVESGATLQLLPATTFVFDGPYLFRISGTLVAEGTVSDSINFTTQASWADRWQGLDFEGIGSSTSQLAYCCIEKGNARANPPDDYYASVLFCRSSSPILTHCIIRSNESDFYGGGVTCLENASPSFSYCTVSGNTSEDGYGAGGGIACFSNSAPNFTDCIVTGNFGGYGGGVCCQSSSAPVFVNCTITGNTATWSGGGVIAFNGSPPSLVNCIVSDNRAIGGSGGGVCCYSSSANLENCTLIANVAGSYGGGAFVYDSSPVLTNTIIAFSSGSGVFFWSNSSLSLIAFCDAFANSGGNIGFFDNDPLQGPPGIGELVATNSNDDSCDAYHNIFVDPQLVNRVAGDFHLTDGSHCIGAADPTNPPPLDMDGNPRPNPPGSNPDIGAYENTHGIPGHNTGYVELIFWPPWGYRLYWVSGSLSRLVFADLHCGASGFVSGDADAAGWTASSYVDSVVFTTSTPLTSGSIDVFWLEAPPECSMPGTIIWTAGDSSGTVEGPLPVELTTFEAIAGEGQVTLRWRTESELDNNHFVLYKRKAGEEIFRKLTEIPGHGTTTEPHDYEFVDRFVQNNITYEYQISDVDITGRETIHEQIVSATPSRSAAPIDFALHPNYPNPFNPTTTIRYDVKETGLVSLKVFDLLGREVATLVDGEIPAGSYSINWDAGDLPSGLYLCRMEAERFVETRKMVLLK